MSITSGLIAYWPMNEPSGTNVEDVEGGFDGTVTGTTIKEDGKISRARTFNGTSDFITVASNSVIGGLTKNFTVSAWVRTTTLASAPCSIFTCAESPSGSVGFEFGIIDTSGNLQFTSKGIDNYFFSNPITNAVWWHILITFGAIFEASLYLNGIFKETITHTADVNANTTQAFFIGAECDNTTTPTRWWFPGDIDDMRIYNRVLTDPEIHQVYTFGIQHFVKVVRPRQFGPGLAR